MYTASGHPLHIIYNFSIEYSKRIKYSYTRCAAYTTPYVCSETLLVNKRITHNNEV